MGVRENEGEVNELSTEMGQRDSIDRVLIFFLLKGTGGGIAQSVESAIGQGRVEGWVTKRKV